MESTVMNDNSIFLESFCIFFAHQKFIERLIKSVYDAHSYFNQCKEYFYILNVPFSGIQKRYSGREIVQLMSKNIRDIKQLPKTDQFYYYYYKNKKFFSNLFSSVSNAQKHRVNVTTYVFNMILPTDFFDKRQIQLMGKDILNFFAYFLQNIRLYQNKHLPLPTHFLYNDYIIY